METISVNYSLKWQLKNMPQYKFSACGRMFNCKTGKLLKRTVNGGSIGYWIGRKFTTLKDLRTQIELIPKQNYPF